MIYRQRYICSIIVIFCVSFSSCILQNRNIHHHLKNENSYILLTIDHNLDPENLKKQLILQVENLVKKKKSVKILGLYNRKVARQDFPDNLSCNNFRGYTNLIYSGKHIWGGVIAEITGEDHLLNWFYEPIHKDIVFKRSNNLIKVGAWYLHDIKKYLIFFYTPDKSVVITDFNDDIEDYARVMIRVFDCVEIFVFKDKIECRKFSSEYNKLELLKTASITPVNRDEFFRPNSTKYGFWFYRLSKVKNIHSDQWRFVK